MNGVMLKLKALVVLSLLNLLTLTVGAEEAEPVLTPAQQEVAAQEALDAFLGQFNWQTEGAGELGDWSMVEIPEGFLYLNGAEADTLMQGFGNLPGEYEGMISAKNVEWFVIFQFEETGYVKDDEKDELDAAALLSQLKADEVEVNEYRKENGYSELHTVGWSVEPKYNEMTNNLEWGLLLRSEDGSESINYKTKLLGRHGIMNVTLVCDPGSLQSILPAYQSILTGHQYQTGESYAEFKQGDKIAEYGLTALIVGGAAYGAAKLGLLGNLVLFFKKGAKLIIAAIVAIGVGIKKFFSKMTGGDLPK